METGQRLSIRRHCSGSAHGVCEEFLGELQHVRAGCKAQPASQRNVCVERWYSGDLPVRAADSKLAGPVRRLPFDQQLGTVYLGVSQLRSAKPAIVVDARVLSRDPRLDQWDAGFQSVRGIDQTADASRRHGSAATNHCATDVDHDCSRYAGRRQSVVELHPAARELAVAGDLSGRPTSVSQPEHWTVRQEFTRAQLERPWRGRSVGRMVVRESTHLHYDGSRSRCGFHRRGDRNRDLRPGTFLEEVA